MENLSLDVSRDLLQRFRGSINDFEVLKENDEEIELNLGLSLGGRFGVDKGCKSLMRSSSIAVCSPVVSDDNDVADSKPITGLVRTSSLPVVTEEEWRKRKELQTLRRMEAKRRRSEKQRILTGDKSSSFEANSGVKRFGLPLEARFGSTSWAARRANYGGGSVAMAKGASQGSGESKVGSSSSVSDLEGMIVQGSSSEPSPTSIPTLKVTNQDTGSSGTKSRDNTSITTGSDIASSPSKKPDNSNTIVGDMPCVFTMGDGPNGRRIDGILYKYGKGEEVKIMCICCGKFHSPAEFVEHAGGTDVDHPLKHIVVNAYASSLL